MIGYVIVGTNDLPRAARFYDRLLGDVGEKRLIDMANMVAWGKTWEQPMFGVTVTSDGAPATPGHGAIVAMVQSSRSDVDKLYARALSLGGEGGDAPAVRGEEGDQGFYAGYIHDLDGHRLCLFFLGPNA